MGTDRSFLLRGLDVAPLLNRLGQVHAIHCDFDFTDLIVLGEAIKVVDREDQCLRHDFVVRNLEVERLIEDRVKSLAMDFRFKLLLLVRQQVDFAVRVTGATGIAGGQILSLDHRHSQLRLEGGLQGN